MSEKKIEVRKDHRAILMKSRLIHWVTTSTAERLQQQLLGQSAHSHILLSELGITINSAEIEGVYTEEAYENLLKVKQGMYQCRYHRWHQRKEYCFCQRDIMIEARKEQKKEETARKEKTPQEIKHISQTLKIMGDELRSRGVLPPQK